MGVPEIVGIAAVARNGVIGADEDIPWRIPEDWRRFRDLTMGQVLVMGRKTYDSIGRPLPGRTTIVVTRDSAFAADGVVAVDSVEAALDHGAALGPSVIYVAGGGQIYRAAWPHLTALELTEVDQEPVGEVTFPPVLAREWREVRREERDGYAFVRYQRMTSV